MSNDYSTVLLAMKNNVKTRGGIRAVKNDCHRLSFVKSLIIYYAKNVYFFNKQQYTKKPLI